MGIWVLYAYMHLPAWLWLYIVSGYIVLEHSRSLCNLNLNHLIVNTKWLVNMQMMSLYCGLLIVWTLGWKFLVTEVFFPQKHLKTPGRRKMCKFFSPTKFWQNHKAFPAGSRECLITRYRFIGGQASGTPDDHIINCRPHGFYDLIICCPNSHNKLTKAKIR